MRKLYCKISNPFWGKGDNLLDSHRLLKTPNIYQRQMVLGIYIGKYDSPDEANRIIPDLKNKVGIKVTNCVRFDLV